MFIGRLDEIKTIERCLFQTKNGNPQHFLVQGERGIGKSSLFFLVSGFADGRIPPMNTISMNFLVLSVDLGNVASQLDIVRAIARELKSQINKIKAGTEAAKKVWDFLSSWEILGVKYNRPTDTVPHADDARDELIDQITALCAENGCEIDGIFIIIDEADAPPVEAGLGEFLKTFTERLTKRGCNKVLVGLAGLPTLLGKLRASHESSPRIFSILTLEPLENEERMDVVRRGLEIANERNADQTSISNDALQLLAELSEGYPHFVQQFSYSSFEANDDYAIDVADVLQGSYGDRGAIEQLGNKYFNEMYYGKISSDDYRKVLDAMSTHSDAWVSRKEIVQESGVKQTTVANAMNALKARNIILSDTSRQGYYKLPTKSFAAWINAIRSVEERKALDLNLFSD